MKSTKKILLFLFSLMLVYCLISIGYSAWIITTEKHITPPFSGQAEITIDNFNNQTTTYDGKVLIDSYDGVEENKVDVKIPTSLKDEVKIYYEKDYIYTLKTKPNGETVNKLISGKPKDAGTYEVRIKAKQDSFHEDIIITLTVKPIVIELGFGYVDKDNNITNVSNSNITKVYNGESYSPYVYPTNLVSDENGVKDECSLTYEWMLGNDESTKNTLIRNHTNSAYNGKVTGCSNQNYVIPDDNTFTFQIEKLKIEVIWINLEFVYDNKQVMPSVNITNKVGSDEVTVNLSSTSSKKDANNIYGATLQDLNYIPGKNKYEAKIESLSGKDANNYELCDSLTHEFIITQKTVEFVAKNSSIVYGSSASNNGYSVTGEFANGENISNLTNLQASYSYSYDKGVVNNRKVGNYNIILSATTSNTNYHLTTKNGVLSVTPKEIEISWNNLEFTYDGLSHLPSASVSNKAYTEDTVGINIDQSYAKVNSHIKDNGGTSYSVKVSGLTNNTNNNYKLTLATNSGVNNTFKINQKDISTITDFNITSSANDLVYKAAQIIPTTLIKDMNSSKNIISSSDYTLTYGENINVRTGGSVIITGKGNYKGSTTQTFDIARRELVINWDSSKVANDKGLNILMYESKEINPGYTFGNIPIAETKKPIGTGTGSKINANINSKLTSVSGGDLSPYQYQITSIDNDNYKLPLSTTTDYYIRTIISEITYTQYGEALVNNINNSMNSVMYSRRSAKANEFTYTYNGEVQTPDFVVSNLIGQDKCDLVVDETEQSIDAGIHSVSINLLKSSNTNYEVPSEQNKVNYEIKAKEIEIEYGATSFDYSGTNKVFNIKPKDSSICARDKGTTFKVNYELMENSVVKDAIKNANTNTRGHKLQTNLKYEIHSLSVVEGSSISKNYILPKDASLLKQEFIIKQVPLTITANNHSITYGDNAGNSDVSYSGFVGGEGIGNSDLLGNITYQYSYDKANKNLRKVGSYNIIPSGLTSNNYYITYNSGVLTVNKLTATYKFTNDQVTYDGLAHKPIASVNNKPYSDDVVNVLVSGEKINANSLPNTRVNNIGVGEYLAQVSSINGNDASNYNLGSATHEFFINQKVLTVTANDATIIYGSNAKNNGVSYSGFVSGESVSNLTNLQTSYSYTYDKTNPSMRVVSASPYEITPSITSSNTNYYFSYVKGALSVTPKELTLNWGNSVFNYTGKKQAPTLSLSGLVDGYNDTVNYTLTGGEINANTKRDNTVFGSNYKVKVTSIDNSNYNLPSQTEKAFNIKQVPLNISMNVSSIIYGNSLVVSKNNYVGNGFVNGEGFIEGASLNYETSYKQNNVNGVVGTYEIKASGYSNTNYEISYATSTFEVTKRTLNVSSIELNKTYNAALQTPTATLSNTVYGDRVKATYNTSYKDANTYTIILNGTNNTNYNITPITYNNFVINKATLNIKVNSNIITYGNKEANKGVSITGWQGSDQTTLEDDLINSIKYTYVGYEANNPSNRSAGDHKITIDYTINSGNYKASVTDGILRVNKRPATITWTNTIFTYNKQTQKPTAKVNELLVGDSCDITITGGMVNAGSYKATATGITNPNYEFGSSVETSYTINPKDITVTWNNQAKVYNGQVQTPIATANGVIEGDTVNLSVTGSGKDAKTYSNVLVSTTNNNYNITNDTTSFTINKKPIAITWNVGTYTYNGLTQAPTISYDSSEIYNNEATIILTDGFINAGSHSVTASINNTNYILSGSATQNYNINKANLNVTIKNHSITYGDDLSNNGATYDGFVNESDKTNLSKGLVITSTYTKFNNASTYPLNGSGIDETNYKVSYTNATLTVNKKQVNVTWDNVVSGVVTYQYTGSNITPTYKVTGNISGHDVTFNLTYETLTGESLTNIVNSGEYNVKLNITNNNYTFSNGNEIIQKVKISGETLDNAVISIPDTTLTYNGLAQTPTVTVTVNGKVVPTDKYDVTYKNNTNAGNNTATITVTGKNGYIGTKTMNFTIAKAILTVTANNKQITYGDDLSNSGVSYSGFVNGENESVLTGTLKITSTYSKGNNVGNYSLTPSGLSSSNYEIKYVNGTLKVVAKDISFTMTSITTNYDGATHSIKVNETVPSGITINYTNNDKVNAGIYTVTANIRSNGNYNVLTKTLTATLTINKVNPTVQGTIGVTYDQAGNTGYFTDDMNVNNIKFTGSYNVSGTIKLKVSKLTIGTNSYEYTFTPSDTTNYNSATGTISINVYAMVTFKDGSNEVKTIDVAKGSKVTAPAVTKTGYEVEGWYNGSTKWNFTSDVVNTNITLTVKWKVINYNITYELGADATASGNPSQYTINDTVTLNNPTRTGYKFLGWTGSGYDTPTLNVSFSKQTGDKHFVANWESANKFRIDFYFKGETNSLGYVNVNAGATVSVPENINALTQQKLLKLDYKYKSSYSWVIKGTDTPADFTNVTADMEVETKLELRVYDINIYYKDKDNLSAFDFIGLGANSTNKNITFGTQISGLTRQFRLGEANGFLFYVTPTDIFNDWECLANNKGNSNFAVHYTPGTNTTNSTLDLVVLVEQAVAITSTSATMPNTQDLNVSTSAYKYHLNVNDAFSEVEHAGVATYLRIYGQTNDKAAGRSVLFGNVVRPQSTFTIGGNTFTIPKYTIEFSRSTLTQSFNLNKNVTVIMPYGRDDTSATGYLLAQKSSTAFSGSAIQSVLTIAEGVLLNIDGTMHVGSITGSSGTTWSHSVIMNHGTINLNSGAVLNAYGYIKGKGTIEAQNGSQVTDIFTIYDWPGGANAYGMNKKNLFPIQCYSFHNVSTKLIIHHQASYGAYYQIAMGDGFQQGRLVLVGAGGLFQLDNNYLIKSAEETTPNTNMNTSYTSSNHDIRQREILEIFGNFTDNKVSITVDIKGITATVSTSTSIAMPIGFMSIHVKNNAVGTLKTNSYKFLPGSELHVDNGSKLTIANGVNTIAYDNFVDEYDFIDSGGTHNGPSYGYQVKHKAWYDQTEFEQGAQVIINGTLDVQGNFGGTIKNTEGTGTVHLKTNSATINKMTYLEYSSISLTGGIGSIVKTRNDTQYVKMYMYDGNNIQPTASYVDAGTYYGKLGTNKKGGWYTTTADISFDVNGGVGDGYPVLHKTLGAGGYTIVAGDIPVNEPTREHYTFGGWYVSPECEDGKEAVGSTIFCSTTLYAKWIPIQYDLTYDLDNYYGFSGPSGTAQNDELNPNAYDLTSNINLRNPINGEYVFGGWYLDAQFTHEITKINGIEIKDYLASQNLPVGPITIYALWYQIGTEEYTITYHMNPEDLPEINATGLDTTIKDKVVSAQADKFEPINLEILNNNVEMPLYFVGWYTNYANGTYSDEFTQLTGNVDLYARYAYKTKVTLNNCPTGASTQVRYYIPVNNFGVPSNFNIDFTVKNGIRMVWFTDSTVNSADFYIGNKLYPNSLNKELTLYGDSYYVVTQEMYKAKSYNLGTNPKVAFTDVVFEYGNMAANSKIVKEGIAQRNVARGTKTPSPFADNQDLTKVIFENCTLLASKKGVTYHYTEKDFGGLVGFRYALIYNGLFENNDSIETVILKDTILTKATFTNCAKVNDGTMKIITNGASVNVNDYKTDNALDKVISNKPALNV